MLLFINGRGQFHVDGNKESSLSLEGVAFNVGGRVMLLVAGAVRGC